MGILWRHISDPNTIQSLYTQFSKYMFRCMSTRQTTIGCQLKANLQQLKVTSEVKLVHFGYSRRVRQHSVALNSLWTTRVS